jgi:hypothetical protein
MGVAMATRKKSKQTGRRRKSRKPERKDRLIQTRITPSLYKHVVERAEALRIPVSNLIRIILEESDKLVGGVLDQSLNIAEAFKDGRVRSREETPAEASRPAEETPVAWQPVIMGRRAVCGDCGCDLFPSEPAHMGLGTDGRPFMFTCPSCFDAMQKELEKSP